MKRCDIDSLREDIALRCHGDLKQALNQLYLISLKYKDPANKEKKIKRLKSGTSTQTLGSQFSMINENSLTFENSASSCFKDREFSLFHTLGKFLYNKSNYKGNLFSKVKRSGSEWKRTKDNELKGNVDFTAEILL